MKQVLGLILAAIAVVLIWSGIRGDPPADVFREILVG